MGRPGRRSRVEEQGQAGSEHRVAENTSKMALAWGNSHVLGGGIVFVALGPLRLGVRVETCSDVQFCHYQLPAQGQSL